LLETRLFPTQRPRHKLSTAVRPELHELLCLVNVIFELGACVDVFLKKFVYFFFTCRVVCPNASSLFVQRIKYFIETAKEFGVFISGAMALLAGGDYSLIKISNVLAVCEPNR
jgi:hypothetical protein